MICLNRLLVGVIALGMLSGCGLFRDSSLPGGKGPRLAKEISRLPELDLSPVAVSGGTVKDLVATEIEVLEAYRAVYGKVGDPEQNQVLGKRLADLELARAGTLSAEGQTSNPFSGAVEIYETLLANAVGDEGRDALLYQLAQSNDMAGDAIQTKRYLDELIADYPDSRHLLEARFRRAEILFSNGDYASAATDYAEVTAAGDDSKYWLHASYMLGWSQFKRSNLDEAAEQFYQVVELTSTDVPSGSAETRPRVSKELLDDALRVLMLTLNYEDGASSLAADMQARNRPEWQYLIYDRLASDYLAQERYLDGVAAWQIFVDENPLDRRAPSATVSIIDILDQADFPSEIAPKKEEFIERYGVRSEFWAVQDEASRASYRPTLRSYLGELSQLRHAQAQDSRRTPDFLAAADYYQQIVETFPADPRTADTLFLLGDVYTDAKLAASALTAYQRLATQFPDHPKAVEAGYSSILALDTLASGAQPKEQEDWYAQRLEAQIDFANTFADDPRASAVQVSAADHLFERENYTDAVLLAKQLLDSRENLDPNLASTARLIVGHGSMELGSYVAAEEAYIRYLDSTSSEDSARSEVKERLLASVYKQGEAAEQEANTDVALNHYLRIATLGPGSEIAALAHYDAIAMMEAASNSTAVANLLASFRDLYPNDIRASEVPGRLAAMFEAEKNYAGAAQEYLNVASATTDSEQRRQAHYLAAELFLKDEDKARALSEFSRYTDTYTQPFDVHMNALDIQDKLLAEQGASRVSLWQRKVNIHSRSGRAASERMNYLAAEASLQLANINRSEFDSLELTAPLKRSLKAKQKSLKGTIKAYKQVIDYGVGDFLAAANFQIADMYVQLSRSIMDSSRPAGLSALELEQYEILLEEQAFPFEEQAIDLHEVNLRRMWQGASDEWTDRSLAALRVLMPGRFDKHEVQVAYVDAIH